MRITVIEASEAVSGQPVVLFQTEIGNAIGIWKGNTPISSGESFDVELDIPGVFAWGKDIFPSNSMLPSLIASHEYSLVTGSMISIGEDGAAAIQLIRDIVLVETLSAPMDIPQSVTIIAPVIQLFSVHL